MILWLCKKVMTLLIALSETQKGILMSPVWVNSSNLVSLNTCSWEVNTTFPACTLYTAPKYFPSAPLGRGRLLPESDGGISPGK